MVKNLISISVIDYHIRKRRGQALLFYFEYNLLPKLISNFNHYMDRALGNYGFMSSGHLSFINQFSKKYHRLTSTASNIKGCQNSTWYLMILTKNICFQNIKIKLNPGTWMTLQSSVVIFQALESLQPQWPLQSQQPQWPQWPRQPHFIKRITDTDS